MEALIELSPSDKGASTIVQKGRTATRMEIKVSVKQLENIITADGEKYAPDPDAIVNAISIKYPDLFAASPERRKLQLM